MKAEIKITVDATPEEVYETIKKIMNLDNEESKKEVHKVR